MRILTVDNLAYDLNKLPETVSDDMAFSVLDNSNPKEPDFFFIPLIYICLLYTSPSPRDLSTSRMPSSA